VGGVWGAEMSQDGMYKILIGQVLVGHAHLVIFLFLPSWTLASVRAYLACFIGNSAL